MKITALKKLQKGFTLIELLVVIAVLGVLAAVVMAAIDPAKKINSAKDANIKSSASEIANAMQVYYTNKATTGTGSYPAAVADLVTAGELKSEPKTPDGTSFTVAKTPGTCTTVAGDCTAVAVYTALKNPTTALNVWCWKSATGQVSELAPASCTP